MVPFHSDLAKARRNASFGEEVNVERRTAGRARHSVRAVPLAIEPRRARSGAPCQPGIHRSLLDVSFLTLLFTLAALLPRVGAAQTNSLLSAWLSAQASIHT